MDVCAHSIYFTYFYILFNKFNHLTNISRIIIHYCFKMKQLIIIHENILLKQYLTRPFFSQHFNYKIHNVIWCKDILYLYIKSTLSYKVIIKNWKTAPLCHFVLFWRWHWSFLLLSPITRKRKISNVANHVKNEYVENGRPFLRCKIKGRRYKGAIPTSQ